MTNREELEAVAKALAEDDGQMWEGLSLQDHYMRQALAARTALLSFGYTKADDLPWRISDIKRGLILFRTSNNAHGYTNHSTLSDRVDALPDRAKQELAGMMINMATGLDPSVMDRFGYTKGNGEMVEAVREAVADLDGGFFRCKMCGHQHDEIGTELDPIDDLRKALSDSEATPTQEDAFEALATMRSALKAIQTGYWDLDTDHEEFRGRVGQIATDALERCEAVSDEPSPLKREGDGEQCDACGRTYRIVYMVSDKVWKAISPGPVGPHPEHMAGGLLCPDCAHDEAEKQGWTLRFFGSESGWPEAKPIPPGELVEAVREIYARAKIHDPDGDAWHREYNTGGMGDRKLDIQPRWRAFTEGDTEWIQKAVSTVLSSLSDPLPTVESVRAEYLEELAKRADDDCARITDHSPLRMKEALGAACYLRSIQKEGK